MGIIGQVSFAVLMVFSIAAVPNLAKEYIVGDAEGWTMNVDYTSWANGKTFAVGDSLVFNYGAMHTVDEVSETEYDSCATGNSITSDSSGASTISLKTSGTHYFICAAMGHCDSGMKLAVTVAETSDDTSSSTSLIPAPTPMLGATTTPTASPDELPVPSSSDADITPMNPNPTPFGSISSSGNMPPTTIPPSAFEPVSSKSAPVTTVINDPNAIEPTPPFSEITSNVDEESSSSANIVSSPVMGALVIGLLTLF
ncbi:hypothetical protein MKW94_001397 [Papaver nudicaule]|uniref:Phytocyanin domain-containing protein n=1 Tax=Papaver nudicaule TaxID=74823 RepID=A0AA41V076_PAPNU|nr:hypothetical protein [Papaver nudicaule]